MTIAAADPLTAHGPDELGGNSSAPTRRSRRNRIVPEPVMEALAESAFWELESRLLCPGRRARGQARSFNGLWQRSH